MTKRAILALALVGLFARAEAAEPAIAPGGVIRAAYIVTNLAQAALDPATGEPKGVIVDVTRELGRRYGLPVAITPVTSAAAVLEAVRTGAADIGFVAPNPDRVGLVLYSQTYMLVQQSFLVLETSPIRSVTELDRAGLTIGANRADSVSVYIRAHFKQAQLLESPDFGLREAVSWLREGKVAAFGGNRQRLRTATQGVPGVRMLPDNLYGVPQTIAVANERPDALAMVNQAIDALRASGFLEQAMARSGVEGVSVAP